MTDPVSDSNAAEAQTGMPKVVYVEGNRITIFADGSTFTETSDGTTVMKAGGKTVTEKPDGTTITEENGFTTTKNPDGSVTRERPFIVDALLGGLAIGLGAGMGGLFAPQKQALSGEDPAPFLRDAMHAVHDHVSAFALSRPAAAPATPKPAAPSA